MKLIIDISGSLYSYISKEDAVYFPDDGEELFEAVKNGTPIPYNATACNPKIEQIKSIINMPHIQEDVLKYKMICEVMEGE